MTNLPMNSSYCIEFFTAKKGCIELLIQSLRALAEICRQEEGCLQYDLMLDQKDLSTVILVVQFETEAQMKRHENQSHVHDFAEGDMKQYCERFTWYDAKAL